VSKVKSKSYKRVVTTIKISIIKKEIHYYILYHYVAFVIYLAFIGTEIFLETVSNLIGRVFENYKHGRAYICIYIVI